MADECGSKGCVTSGCPSGASVVAGESVRRDSTTVLAVPDMCCPTEFAMVDRELRRISGVSDVTPDYMGKAVRIAHAAVPDATLLGAAKRSGLEVHLPAPLHAAVGLAGHLETPAENASATTSVASKAGYWKLLAGGVLALAAEGFAFAYGDASWFAIAFAVAAIALSGLETYRKGWIAVRQVNLNINALMSVAVTGAAILGQWPEAAMVMVLFALAETIEAKSLDRARRAVEGLMTLTPEMATVRASSGWEAVPAAGVSIGSIVRVRPGERVALDGKVTSGVSAVDQSPITGESVPVDKAMGDPVFAGTVNQNGELEYEVTARSGDSTLARIIRAVHEAQGTRAPIQRFVDTFSKYYTPAVFAIAIAVALVPPLFFGSEWVPWIYRALVMLVIACPCALVISTPVSIVSGLTAAARRGILIKGGLYLEQGHRLKVVAFDKTGTLTLGRPTLTDAIALRGTERDVLRIASVLAQRSDHPVSKAVAARAGDEASLAQVTGFTALGGRGIEGSVDGVLYRLGNHRLVEESNACSPELEAKLAELEQLGKTAVVLVGNGTAIGIFAVADAVRKESADAVAQLKQLGIRPVMLTGDNRHTAEAIARQVGISDVRSELLPQDKLEAIEALSAGAAVVGMVGDGINDAPALARADIGLAMGAAGTGTAIETADVALMDDDLRKVAQFVRLSRATKAVLWQNIALALSIKVVFLALALAGQATLWMAVFADMGASLIVVFNGLRLLRRGAA